METKNFYATPEMKVLEFQTEGVLCESGEHSFNYYDGEIDL